VLQSAPRQSPWQAVQYVEEPLPATHTSQFVTEAQAVSATEQSGPVHPAAHTQRGGSSPTSTHLPWFEHSVAPTAHSAARHTRHTRH
jgi:hypothetical protein